MVWKERAKIGEDPLRVFKIFHSSIEINRNTALENKRDGNCHVSDSCWAILPSLLLAEGGNLDISPQLSYTL
jgi:hypothetical protein